MNQDPRILFVAWQAPTNRAIYPFARLVVRPTGDEPRYELAYVRGLQEARAQGLRLGVRDVNEVIRSNDLPPFLENRLMSPRRPDYREHIESLGLGDNPAPIAILARSDGSAVTDNLEVFAHPTFDIGENAWVYYGFCRGIRHVSSEECVADLSAGDHLANAFDPRALLLLKVDQQKLGYVPHTLIDDLTQAMELRVDLQVMVARVNPKTTPVQQRLLVRIAVEATYGFRPLSTPRYEPISSCAMRVTAEDLMHCG